MNRQKTDGRASGTRILRRTAAAAGIVLLAGLYLVTFILGIFGDARSAGLLRLCFGLTIFLPLFLWVVIWCVGFFRRRGSIASLRILDSDPEERRRMEEAVAKEMAAKEKKKGRKNPVDKRLPE